MTLKNKKDNIWDYFKGTVHQYLGVIAGCFILAISVNVFLNPNNFVLGGVTGIGTILYGLFNIEPWLTTIVINIPLFLIGYKAYDIEFFIRTIFGTLMLSFALWATKFLPSFKGDLFLACIFGGVLDGVGLGLIFKNRFSTGGTDLFAYIIKKYLKYLPLPKILLFLDGIIILAGAYFFGFKITLYAIISVFIVSKVSSTVIDGFNFAKAVYIISDKHDEIGEKILKTLNRGATSIKAEGMYTKTKKDIILCVVEQKKIPELKEVIYEVDESAFVIISSVNEVVGEGFKHYKE